MKKEYIGDGVYVEHNQFGLILTTENGIEVTNRIVLDWEYLKHLQDYITRLTEPKSND